MQKQLSKSLETQKGPVRYKTQQEKYEALKRFDFFKVRTKRDQKKSKRKPKNFSIDQQKTNIKKRKDELDFYTFMKIYHPTQQEKNAQVKNLLFIILQEQLFKYYRAVLQVLFKKLIKKYPSVTIILDDENVKSLYTLLLKKIELNKEPSQYFFLFYYLFLKQIYRTKDILNEEHLVLLQYLENSQLNLQTQQKTFRLPQQKNIKIANKQYQFINTITKKSFKKRQKTLTDDLIKVNTEKENFKIQCEDLQAENKDLTQKLLLFEKSLKSFAKKINDLKYELANSKQRQNHLETQCKNYKIDNQFFKNLLNKKKQKNVQISETLKDKKYGIKFFDNIKSFKQDLNYQYIYQKKFGNKIISSALQIYCRKKLKLYSTSITSYNEQEFEEECTVYDDDTKESTVSLEQKFFKKRIQSVKNFNQIKIQNQKKKSMSMINLFNIRKQNQKRYSIMKNKKSSTSSIQTDDKLEDKNMGKIKKVLLAKHKVKKSLVNERIKIQQNIRKFSVQQKNQNQQQLVHGNSQNIKNQSLILKIPDLKKAKDKKPKEQNQKNQETNRPQEQDKQLNVLSFNGSSNLLQSFGSKLTQQKMELMNLNKNVQQVQRLLKKNNIKYSNHDSKQEILYLQIFYCLRVILSEEINLKCIKKTGMENRKYIYIKCKFKQLERILQDEIKRMLKKNKKKSQNKRKALILYSQDFQQYSDTSCKIVQTFLIILYFKQFKKIKDLYFNNIYFNTLKYGTILIMSQNYKHQNTMNIQKRIHKLYIVKLQNQQFSYQKNVY